MLVTISLCQSNLNIENNVSKTDSLKCRLRVSSTATLIRIVRVSASMEVFADLYLPIVLDGCMFRTRRCSCT